MASENADPVMRAFLGVEQSATGQRWIARLDQAGENRALAMSQSHGLPDLISRDSQPPCAAGAARTTATACTTATTPHRTAKSTMTPSRMLIQGLRR